eukprot:4119316-Pyramimonas_sp.AAC.1
MRPPRGYLVPGEPRLLNTGSSSQVTVRFFVRVTRKATARCSGGSLLGLGLDPAGHAVFGNIWRENRTPHHRVVENRVEHSLPGSFRRPSAGNCGCGGQHRMVGAGPPKHHEGARHRGANRGAHARQRQARGRVLLPPDLSRMPRSAPEGIVIIDGVDAGRYPE